MDRINFRDDDDSFDGLILAFIIGCATLIPLSVVAGLRWLGLDMSYWWAGLPAALALLFLAWLLIKARI
jgi:hypothetical protein